LSLCDMVGCDLTFGLSQSKSRAPVRDRFRQFPAATRFDTVWAEQRRMAIGLHRPTTAVVAFPNRRPMDRRDAVKDFYGVPLKI
jgi:hypothetical protein